MSDPEKNAYRFCYLFLLLHTHSYNNKCAKVIFKNCYKNNNNGDLKGHQPSSLPVVGVTHFLISRISYVFAPKFLWIGEFKYRKKNVIHSFSSLQANLDQFEIGEVA